MVKLVCWLETLTETIGKTIAWLTLGTVLLSFLVVLLRYGFNLGSIALQESVLYAHATVFMVGAAYTLKHQGHVRVDIFYQRMSKKSQAWVDLLGTLVLLLPVCIFILVICFDFVSQSWMINEKSPEPGGLPIVYLNKTLLLILPTMLIVQALAEIMKQVLIIRGVVIEKTLTDDEADNGVVL